MCSILSEKSFIGYNSCGHAGAMHLLSSTHHSRSQGSGFKGYDAPDPLQNGFFYFIVEMVLSEPMSWRFMCNCMNKKLEFETLVVTRLTNESCLPRVGAHHYYKCCDHAGVIIFGIGPSFKVSGFIV